LTLFTVSLKVADRCRFAAITPIPTIMENPCRRTRWLDVAAREIERPEPAGDEPGGLFAVRKHPLERNMSDDKTENRIDKLEIDFAKMDGLVPGIVQDAATGEVLMLGFLNPTSYAKTLESGFVTFWSRTRQKLWMKGETSGNRLRVVSASTDCDQDTLLFRVVVEGDGLVCHEGTVSCFTRPIVESGEKQTGVDREEARG
jgi:phosphoribosyl-AMP cyclohydrolase